MSEPAQFSASSSSSKALPATLPPKPSSLSSVPIMQQVATPVFAAQSTPQGELKSIQTAVPLSAPSLLPPSEAENPQQRDVSKTLEKAYGFENLRRICFVSLELKDFEKVKIYAQELKDLKQKEHPCEILGDFFLGESLAGQGQYKEAAVYYENVVKNAKEGTYKFSRLRLSQWYQSLGRIYGHLKNFEKVGDCYCTAEKTIKHLFDKNSFLRVETTIGMAQSYLLCRTWDSIVCARALLIKDYRTFCSDDHLKDLLKKEMKKLSKSSIEIGGGSLSFEEIKKKMYSNLSEHNLARARLCIIDAISRKDEKHFKTAEECIEFALEHFTEEDPRVQEVRQELSAKRKLLLEQH